jgi:hypothetical protein
VAFKLRKFDWRGALRRIIVALVSEVSRHAIASERDSCLCRLVRFAGPHAPSPPGWQEVPFVIVSVIQQKQPFDGKQSGLCLIN